MDIAINIRGIGKVSKILSRLTARVRDLKPAWRQIVDNFHELERQQFDTEGSRVKAWKPLTQKYTEWKQKNYPGRKILVRTGALKNSLTMRTSDSIIKMHSNSLKIGTRTKYAIYHEKGNRKRNLSIRRLINPKRSDITEWLLIIRNYILEKTGFIGR